MAAVDWPDVSELKAVLDVEGEDWNVHLDGLMTAAIDKVKQDVGSWDESTDTPDAPLRNAALRAAIVLQTNNGNPTAIDTDGVYAGHMKGHRRTFGFA